MSQVENNFEDVLFREIITTLTIKPAKPQIEIKNPLDGNIFCNGIECLLGIEFTRKGIILITIGNIPVFNSETGSFKNYSKFPVAVGKPMKRDDSIKIFAWNKTDTNKIDVAFNISLGKKFSPIQTLAIPISGELVNTFVSELDTVFPIELRTVGFLESKILFMNGYKKLILIISSGAYVSPLDLIGGFKVADGDLNTFGDSFTFLISVIDGVFGKVDFGSIKTRVPSGKFKLDGGTNTWKIKLQTSNNNSTWTDVANKDATTQDIFTISGSSSSFRYLRFVTNFETGTSQNMTFECAELFDGNEFGGQGEVSFEVADGFGGFIPLITAGSIGAVSQGEEVVKTIGDVINDKANDKFNFALPSTQTDFKIKLKVITASVTIGVSLQRIS